MELDERQWWIDFKRGDSAAREQLLQKYLPFAKHLTRTLYSQRPVNNIEFGDYLHFAYTGLLEAMQRYQHEANASFLTYAAYRIKGAILNGIPKMSEQGEYSSYLRRARSERTQSLLGSSSPGELDFSQAVDLIVSIAITYQLDELGLDNNDPTGAESDPYASHSYDQMKVHLNAIVSQLPARDQQIIRYHYFDHSSFDDIATLLGISKSRVSQLHKRIMSKLRTQLQEQGLNKLY